MPESMALAAWRNLLRTRRHEILTGTIEEVQLGACLTTGPITDAYINATSQLIIVTRWAMSLDIDEQGQPRTGGWRVVAPDSAIFAYELSDARGQMPQAPNYLGRGLITFANPPRISRIYPRGHLSQLDVVELSVA